MTKFIHHDFNPGCQALFLSQSRRAGKVITANAALRSATLSAVNLFNRDNNTVIYRFIAAYLSKLIT
ncbi:hypothetical protein [Mixta theicola]|uniref:hypothetical protein n=1 Tax=Mixta theicola TaxID=1458355 RepID=UPI0013FE00ED|nr:hypothetical protein [Mixta theicola]GLR07639.1 hypothetical protein GCM10007905_03580 [Mixta theicola]